MCCMLANSLSKALGQPHNQTCYYFCRETTMSSHSCSLFRSGSTVTWACCKVKFFFKFIFLDFRIADKAVWTWLYNHTNSVSVQRSRKKPTWSHSQGLPFADLATMDKAPYSCWLCFLTCEPSFPARSSKHQVTDKALDSTMGEEPTFIEE